MQTVIFLNKLNHLNLDAVAQKLTCCKFGDGWTIEKTQWEIIRYKQFLYLNFLLPHRELAPDWEIDKVWHTHILIDTYQYIQDCQNLFGYILHHRSSQENDKNCNQNQNKLTDFTQVEFEEYLNLDIWKNIRYGSYDIAACVTIPGDFTICKNLFNPVHVI